LTRHWSIDCSFEVTRKLIDGNINLMYSKLDERLVPWAWDDAVTINHALKYSAKNILVACHCVCMPIA
jgi:hypothetical protein